MAFSTRDEQDAIDYLTLDSPKTPKVLIADAEAAVTSAAITTNDLDKMAISHVAEIGVM